MFIATRGMTQQFSSVFSLVFRLIVAKSCCTKVCQIIGSEVERPHAINQSNHSAIKVRGTSLPLCQGSRFKSLFWIPSTYKSWDMSSFSP
ncbi:hypothetical protein EDD17DRAFT_1656337 [Pisolithus thermaeus]|nr:hypothetical protein EDD17DRAFT_1656337 [Pisolithus thermaeus]